MAAIGVILAGAAWWGLTQNSAAKDQYNASSPVLMSSLGVEMDIIQPLFFIPPDIEAKSATGEFIRYGGVLRNLSGQIVKHLKEIQLPDDAGEAVVSAVSGTRGDREVLKNPKTIVIGLTVVTITAAVGGTVAYLARRSKQSGEQNFALSVQNFNVSLSRYLESARNGSLGSETIDQLIADLDAVKAETEDSTITVEFLPEHSEALVTIGLITREDSLSRIRYT